ncbi:hypothetical protein [Planococcus lenghuensis]|uniref:Uncharacterized protein n=1 Tax=Planococcus lenghuensis TaxID=2213202 RepID=A0A1Q2L1G2_9BACL|nr:hypothetical protein [Planococcus lenghuensis]AQQ54279.1 hypothetical protein B0X71_15015 [Planococcus lenghuensis]
MTLNKGHLFLWRLVEVKEQSVFLKEHSPAFKEHSPVFKVHSIFLKEHSPALKEHSPLGVPVFYSKQQIHINKSSQQEKVEA